MEAWLSLSLAGRASVTCVPDTAHWAQSTLPVLQEHKEPKTGWHHTHVHSCASNLTVLGLWQGSFCNAFAAIPWPFLFCHIYHAIVKLVFFFHLKDIWDVQFVILSFIWRETFLPFTYKQTNLEMLGCARVCSSVGMARPPTAKPSRTPGWWARRTTCMSASCAYEPSWITRWQLNHSTLTSQHDKPSQYTTLPHASCVTPHHKAPPTGDTWVLLLIHNISLNEKQNALT